MPLLEVPYIILGVSALTLLVNVWIGYGLHYHRHYDGDVVPLRMRLRHPTMTRDELAALCKDHDQ